MQGSTQDVEQRVLEELASRLDGDAIKRSVIETVIAERRGGAELRRRIDTVLAEAAIHVVEDALVPHSPADDSTRPPKVSEPVDPRDIARKRLSKDRLRQHRRLAKVILEAEEEVGLTLLARPDGEPLPPGGFAALTGESRDAAVAMLLHNMGLIHSVAHRMGGQGLEYDDLVASGVPGLIRAIEKFDPHRGLKFSTYAMHWVRQSIGRAVDDEGRIVRLPVHVCEAIRALKSAQERLTVDGRPPSRIALAEECGTTVEKVEELLRLAPAVVSLDSPVGNDGVTLGDLLDRPVARREPVEVNGLDKDDLEALLGRLAPREQDVLRRRHGLRPYADPTTLDEIGTAYGLTRERIRQIESKALTKVRVHLGLEVPTGRKKRGTSPALAKTA